MGIVHVQYEGRAGNALFQYCLGRILAGQLGYDLAHEAIPGFIDQASQLAIDPEKSHRTYRGHVIDVEKLLQEPPDTIVLNGPFQRYEYFKAHRDEIRTWIRVESPSVATLPGEEDLVVHVRVGDLREGGRLRGAFRNNYHRIVPFGWYRKLLRTLTWRRLYIVSDSPRDPVVQKLCDEFGGTIQSGSLSEDFHFLMSAKRLIMSVSTFAWWAAWLSDAREVYVPLCGIWNRRIRPDIDMKIHDDGRFIYPFQHVFWADYLMPLVVGPSKVTRKAKRWLLRRRIMRDKRFIARHRGGPLCMEDHQAVARWAAVCAERACDVFWKDAEDPRPGDAVQRARAWGRGEISVGEARQAAVAAHAAARAAKDAAATAAARAAAHAVATAHMADHGLEAADYALRAAELGGVNTVLERRWQDEQVPDAIRDLIRSARSRRRIDD